MHAHRDTCEQIKVYLLKISFEFNEILMSMSQHFSEGKG